MAFLKPDDDSVKMVCDAYNGLLRSLLANEGFRSRFCARMAELLNGPLSDEDILWLEADFEPDPAQAEAMAMGALSK